MKFLDEAPRHLFFTGKGGVGKTSIACASAVALTSAGRRVLLVSTDPASNVGQVFGQTIGNRVTAITEVPGLDALEIDPEQAATAYRDRIIAPIRGLLSAQDLASVTEQLSGACTTEIASFNEFTALLVDSPITRNYEHIVFDTAPTGHTVRLLRLPGEWTRYLDDGRGDPSCLGPLSGLEKTRAIYAEALAALADPARTRLVLVVRAQRSAVDEAARTVDELAEAGVRAHHVVVNGVLPQVDDDDRLAGAIRGREAEVLAHLPEQLSRVAIDELPLHGRAMVGLDALRALLDPGPDPELDGASPVPGVATAALPRLSVLVDDLAQRDHGLVILMGKGGVGKTTLAAAVALALAERGKDVHLTTTDPASHLAHALGTAAGGIKVSSIDPDQAAVDYTERVMRTKGAGLDEQGRTTLAEDLRSPCTQEVAVFQAFSRMVNEARRRFVVMDTAPTGHTLLLLDATGSYHREVARTMGESSRFSTPLMRLQDPDHTQVVIVTLAETTPVLEASGLADDLERAGITPWAWVVNQAVSLAATNSQLLRRRGVLEAGPIAQVLARGGRVAGVPMQEQAPVGADAVLDLAT